MPCDRRLLVLPLVAGACDFPQPDPDTGGQGETGTDTGKSSGGFVASVLVAGLENPFEVVAGSDGYLWVTERTAGRVTRVSTADGSTMVACTERA